MTADDRHPVILDTSAPPAPDYVLEVAEAFAECVRVMNHATRHHEALRYPSEADRLIREVSSGVIRLPQLLSQVRVWLEQEEAAGRIEVPSGEYQGNPLLAVTTARLRLEMAETVAGALQQALDDAASVTSGLAAAETGEDTNG
jgi:hypothetical protein